MIDEIRARVEAVGAEFDGTERNARELRVFCYGPDADAMFAAIAPDIDGWRLAKGSVALLRHGEAGDDSAAEFTVSLEPGASRTPRPRKRQARRKRHRVGDWFAQPVLGRGWVVGRVVAAGGPQLIAYYFGPFRSVPPELMEVEDLRPRDAFTYVNSGDHALRDGGDAVVLGGRDDFDEAAWPLPEFVWTDHRGQAWGISHDRKANEIRPRRKLARWPKPKGEPHAITLGSPNVELLVQMIERGLLPTSARDWLADLPSAQPGDWD